MNHVFDVVVIGAGIVGSAAARHLSTRKQLSVCLIGPDEPSVKKESFQSNFGSHYDEGRITRLVDPDPIKQVLAKRSIERYHELEDESGVKFYNEVGVMFVVQEGGNSEKLYKKGIDNFKLPVQEYDAAELKNKFPYLKLEKPNRGYYQQTNAGYISARGIVKAQKIIAQKNGCTLVNDSAEGIKKCESSGLISVHLEKGQSILTKKVLVCTGAFSNFSGLFGGRNLDLTTFTEPTIRYALSKDDIKRLNKMPSIIFKDETNLKTRHDCTCYILPPILYPDGKYYIKMGQGGFITRKLITHKAMLDWFRGDVLDSDREFLMRIMSEVLPDIKPESIKTDTCVLTTTPTKHMYIGMVSDQVGLAVGGNGHAAKFSDELGNIAARMIIKGSWDYDIPQDLFLPQFIQETSLASKEPFPS